MNIILTGATGFAGGEVLRQALDDPGIDQVLVLTRRPVGVTHPKLKEAVLETFVDYSGVELNGHDACIWCLGISQTKVSEADYIHITCDYAVAAARAMTDANPELRFCFLSGRGADQTEDATALFGRIKGRTERLLSEVSRNTFSFRPGYIRPTEVTGPRKDVARFFAPLGHVISIFSEDFGVDCDQLAKCMLDVAKNGADEHLFTNAMIRSWGV